MDNREATSKQTWAIFCMSGMDVRECKLTLMQASEIITKLKNGEVVIFPQGAILKRQVKKEVGSIDWLKVYEEAVEAGLQALQASKPTPMTVVQHEDPLNDNSKVKQAWHVEGGVCGFAWINIPCKGKGLQFINCMKKEGLAQKRGQAEGKRMVFNPDGYYGGYTYWVHDGGQSMERKMAYADAFTTVLDKYGVEASSMSRMD